MTCEQGTCFGAGAAGSVTVLTRTVSVDRPTGLRGAVNHSPLPPMWSPDATPLPDRLP